MSFLLCYKDLKYEVHVNLLLCILGSEYDSYEINVPIVLFRF